MQKILMLFLVLSPSLVCSQQKKSDSVKLFFFGGQSNIDGHGFNKELPKSLNKTFKMFGFFMETLLKMPIKKVV